MARHTGAANGWIKGSLKLLLPPRYGHQQANFLENHHGWDGQWDHTLTMTITTQFWVI